jgi:hypothetical protein
VQAAACGQTRGCPGSKAGELCRGVGQGAGELPEGRARPCCRRAEGVRRWTRPVPFSCPVILMGPLLRTMDALGLDLPDCTGAENLQRAQAEDLEVSMSPHRLFVWLCLCPCVRFPLCYLVLSLPQDPVLEDMRLELAKLRFELGKTVTAPRRGSAAPAPAPRSGTSFAVSYLVCRSTPVALSSLCCLSTWPCSCFAWRGQQHAHYGAAEP